MALGFGAVQEARYEQAVTEFAKMVQANPVFSILHFLYAIVLALAGRTEDARPAVARGLELELEPSFCSRLIYQVGIAREIADRLAEGARILGLPE
jgi:predicted Zn-dependent protease